MFRSILVPVDGSEISMQAARLAIEVAREQGASLTAMYVIDTPEIAVLAGSKGYKEMEREMRRYGEKILAQVEEMAEGIKFNRVLRTGSAYFEIVEEDKRGDYDLVVIGRRGRAQVALGSTAERVVRYTPSPTLVVGEPAEY